MQNPIPELLRFRGLLWQMTLRDFRSKYAGSLIGVFWSVINPLLLLAVFTFIFTAVFKARFGDHPGIGVSALYILAGILPWLAVQDGLSRAGTVVLENQNLVTRARFPLSVLPAFPALSSLIGQLAGLAALAVIAGVTLRPPGLSLIALPLLLALQLAITIGLAMIISAIAVFLRDLVHVLPVLLLVWMYGTPIFYPAELVPQRFRIIISANPLAHLVMAYRRVLLEASWPDPASLLVLLAFAAATLILGALLFRKLAPGFADSL